MNDSSKLVMVMIAGAFAGAALACITPYILPVTIGCALLVAGAVYAGRQTTDNLKSEY